MNGIRSVIAQNAKEKIVFIEMHIGGYQKLMVVLDYVRI